MRDKRYWRSGMLICVGCLFLFAGFYLIIWNYESPNVASQLDTIYQLHQFIGLIGLLFSSYIFYESGRIMEKYK